VVPVLVAVAALVVGLTDYGRFLEQHRHLWTGAVHDRHAHYLTGLSLALDVRQGNLSQFLHDFDGIRVWPPLHALLVGTVLTITGPDHRYAVLPSLLAWMATVLLAFLTARRSSVRGGTLAGLVAALLVLTSSPHRAFATDTMLESLGACVTLLGLYVYLVTVQGTSARNGRWLGLALTLLFLTKFNYWTLVVLAIVAAEVSTRPRIYRQLLVDAIAACEWRRWLAAEVRQPLNFVVMSLLVLIAYVMFTGGTVLQLGQQTVSLQTPHNLVHLAYAILLLRVALWWRRAREGVLARLDERARPLVAWHVWPVALWFLMPKRLSYFLWYMSPAQAGERPQYGLEHGITFYWSCLTEDYGRGVLMSVLVVLMVVAAFIGVRRLRPGGRVLLWFLLIAVLLTVNHPNRKSRFLHSWVPVGWVAAGVGLAVIVNGRLTRRLPWARPVLATAAIGGLACACVPGLAEAGKSPEGGLKPALASNLELTDCYLPALADARRPVVLATMPMKFLCQWTYLEQYPHGRRLETDIKGVNDLPEPASLAFTRWLETTHADVVVYIDVPRTAPFFEYVPGCESQEQLRDWLEGQSVFSIAHRYHFRDSGSIVTVWKR